MAEQVFVEVVNELALLAYAHERHPGSLKVVVEPGLIDQLVNDGMTVPTDEIGRFTLIAPDGSMVPGLELHLIRDDEEDLALAGLEGEGDGVPEEYRS